MSERELFKEAWDPAIENALAFACSGVSNGASDIGFPHTGGSRDDDVLVLVDEASRAELYQETLVELSLCRELDVLDASSGDAEFGFLENFSHAPVFASKPFSIDQESQACIEIKVMSVHVLLLCKPCIGHGMETKCFEFVGSGFCKHVDNPFNGSTEVHGCCREWIDWVLLGKVAVGVVCRVLC